MKNLKKKMLLTIVATGILVTTQVNFAQAVLESRPDSTSLVSKTASEFFALIRKMETSEGPLGLNATIDDAGNETSGSNNIDVHMIKNTEYGTIGMLANSVYGAKTSTGIKNGTTTGNATGVYQMGTTASGDKDEYVAGIYGEVKYSANVKNIKNAPQKYWDNYTLEKVFKPGDGTLEIGWNTTIWVTANDHIFKRDRNYGVFYTQISNGSSNNTVSSRAVVVSGAGL